MRSRRFSLCAICCAVATGCTSLSTSMSRSASDYNRVLEDYADETLLASVLRARDFAPLNISNLSSITGSLSLTAGLSATHVTAARGGKTDNTIAPNVTGTTSPTWSMSPLNTQGFTLSIMQPVSPSYVFSKWENGVNRYLLMMLFVKAIKAAPDAELGAGASSSDAQADNSYYNNPDDDARFAAFQKELIKLLGDTDSSSRLKLLTVLEPVGPAYTPKAMSQTATVAGGANAGTTTTTNQVNQASAATLQAWNAVTALGDAQYHIGNFVPATAGGGGGGGGGGGQDLQLRLYRMYANQVTLCVDEKRSDVGKNLAAALDEKKARRQAAAASAARGEPAEIAVSKENDFLHLDTYSALVASTLSTAKGAHVGGGGGGSTGGGSSSGGAGTKTTSAPSTSTPSSVGAAIETNRVSAIVAGRACKVDQIVQPTMTEEDFEKVTGNFSHVEWRSIAEVIEYLGAIARWQDNHPNELVELPGDSKASILFRVIPQSSTQALGGTSLIQVDYRGVTYGVGNGADPINLRDASSSKKTDHTLEALAFINELLGTARVSSDLPVTPQLQVLP